MENLDVIVGENHQVNQEKPPPRVCPRCSSDNTKFCYYNNYNVSQPRYNCRNCRRFWTHGGVLRDIPVGGRARKIKRTSVSEPSVPQEAPVTPQVNHHQPLMLQAQETNEFLGAFGGSSSSHVAVGNHLSSSSEANGDRMPPIQSIPPMDPFPLSDGLFPQGYYGLGFSGFVGNPWTNQATGGHGYDYNSFLVKQEDPNNHNQSFNNNNMNMNHTASTNGSGGYPGSTDHMIDNKCVFTPSYPLEKHGP